MTETFVRNDEIDLSNYLLKHRLFVKFSHKKVEKNKNIIYIDVGSQFPPIITQLFEISHERSMTSNIHAMVCMAAPVLSLRGNYKRIWWTEMSPGKFSLEA